MALVLGCSSGAEENPAAPDADTPGNGSTDAGGDAGSIVDPVKPTPEGSTRYVAGARHSAMSASVVSGLRALLSAGTGKRGVFAKVGDSITVSSSFLHCFDGSDVRLESLPGLEKTRQFFRTEKIGADTSFSRDSLAAVVGWSARASLVGTPSPLDRELAATLPTFAVLMFGTNDTYEQGVFPFETSLRKNIEAILSKNVIPLVSTIPPRGDKEAANQLVPEMNAIIRALAEAYQVPLMDYHQTLLPLPKYGLATDGVHPTAYPSHPCWFDKDAMQFGSNQRNLITIEALDRAKRFLVDNEVPESSPPALEGIGSWEDPLIVDALPFAHAGDTSKSKVQVASSYSCAPSSNEGGPEILYKLSVSRPMKLRARVYVDDGVDVDLHLLSMNTAAKCTARDNNTLVWNATPGENFLSVDTFVSSGTPRAGRFRITIAEVP